MTLLYWSLQKIAQAKKKKYASTQKIKKQKCLFILEFTNKQYFAFFIVTFPYNKYLFWGYTHFFQTMKTKYMRQRKPE